MINKKHQGLLACPDEAVFYFEAGPIESLVKAEMSPTRAGGVRAYGVTAFRVTRRSSEIGLRMALGARGRTVIGMVLKEVLVLTGAGIAIALPSAWWLSKFLESQLFGVAPSDPVTIALATLSLLAVTTLAGAVPPFRASGLSLGSRYE